MPGNNTTGRTQSLTGFAQAGGVLKQVSEAFKTYQIARTNFIETLKVSRQFR